MMLDAMPPVSVFPCMVGCRLYVVLIDIVITVDYYHDDYNITLHAVFTSY